MITCISPGILILTSRYEMFDHDLDVTGTLQKEELLQLPHLAYYISRKYCKW